MHILFLLQDYPNPPANGTQLKAYNLIDWISRDHHCDILSFERSDSLSPDRDWGPDRNVKVLGLHDRSSDLCLQLRRLRHLIQGTPLSLARWESESFREDLELALRQTDYDLVHFDFINMAQYSEAVGKTTTILSTNDAVSRRFLSEAEHSSGFTRILNCFTASRILDYERSTLPKFDAVHVVSEKERSYLEARIPEAEISVISITVEPGYLEGRPKDEPGEPVIFTAGDLATEGMADAMRSFVSRGLPRVRKHHPSVKLKIIARNAPGEVLAQLGASEGVDVYTWVEDYKETMAQADLAVFLDRAGAGIKNRCLQALALGIPVVGTPVAMEGIGDSDSGHCWVATTSEEIGEACRKLLSDRELRGELGRRGREAVLRNFAPSVVGKEWEALYREITASQQ